MNAEPRRQRSDARANRERLLIAAGDAILRRGQSVPMAEIAELANVGVGTLYRNFPTREDLFSALIHRSLQTVVARVEVAAGMPGDSIDAIGWFLRETIAHRDELILPLHGVPPVVNKTSAELQRQIRAGLEQVLDRGRQDGTVRDGITAGDIITTGAMLAQPLANVQDWDARAHRQAQIFLAGVRPPR